MIKIFWKAAKTGGITNW